MLLLVLLVLLVWCCWRRRHWVRRLLLIWRRHRLLLWDVRQMRLVALVCRSLDMDVLGVCPAGVALRRGTLAE